MKHLFNKDYRAVDCFSLFPFISSYIDEPVGFVSKLMNSYTSHRVLYFTLTVVLITTAKDKTKVAAIDQRQQTKYYHRK